MVSSGQLRGRTVRLSVGRLFFDRRGVIVATEKAERQRLSKAGAFVRRRAKSSIRQARRKRLAELDAEELRIYQIAVAKAKAAGRRKPRPWWFKHSEPGQPPRSISGLLRKHIYFTWDERTRTTVVGPALLSGAPSANTIPEVLEYGGVITNRRGRRSVIAPRPFMRPALEAEMHHFPDLFRNSIRTA